MHRRSVLALLGASLGAGCSALGSDAPPGTDTPMPSTPSSTPTPTSTPPGQTDTDDGDDEFPRKAWSLVDLEPAPLTVSLTRTQAGTRDEGAVSMQFAATSTADHPAILRGQFRNENPFPNTFRLRELPLFRTVPSAWPGGRPRSEQYTYRDELVLAPTANHEVATAVPDWTLSDGGRWLLDDPVDGPWLPETRRLGPGESFQFEYALVGRGEGFPPARYHFEGHGERDVVFDVWPTAEPGPADPSRFEGATPAALPEADRMAWFHRADAATPVYLEPDRERVALPGKIRFTLVNHSRRAATGNPYFWRLWKRVDGQWFHVAPWGWPAPLTMVPPGGVERWSLAAFTGHAVRCDDAHAVGFLGGGRYAFEVGIGRGTRSHAALLDLEGPPAEVVPTDGLSVTREDGRVRVEWPRRIEEVPRATLTLTRAAQASTRLITEQVMQPRNDGLRNVLAFVDEGTDRVVLVTDRNTVSQSARTGGYEDGSFRFRHRGQAYEATADFGA